MDNHTARLRAQLFKALMHPARLQILDLLRDGPQCVCHLEAHLGRPQAYISQQLALLRKAGLVADQREGLNIYYGVARPELPALLDAAWAMVGAAEPRASPVVACPCPRCAAPQEQLENRILTTQE